MEILRFKLKKLKYNKDTKQFNRINIFTKVKFKVQK